MGLYQAMLNMPGVKRYDTGYFPDDESTLALVREGHLRPVEVADEVKERISGPAPKKANAGRDVEAVKAALAAAREAAKVSEPKNEGGVVTSVTPEPVGWSDAATAAMDKAPDEAQDAPDEAPEAPEAPAETPAEVEKADDADDAPEGADKPKSTTQRQPQRQRKGRPASRGGE